MFSQKSPAAWNSVESPVTRKSTDCNKQYPEDYCKLSSCFSEFTVNVHWKIFGKKVMMHGYEVAKL